MEFEATEQTDGPLLKGRVTRNVSVQLKVPPQAPIGQQVLNQRSRADGNRTFDRWRHFFAKRSNLDLWHEDYLFEPRVLHPEWRYRTRISTVCSA